MCGRFVRSSPAEKLITEFRLNHACLEVPPSFNAAPSDVILIMRNDGERRLRACEWGFVPAWSKDPSAGLRIIHARAETVALLPAFRSAFFLGNRCLIAADGFYEWQKMERGKKPFYVRLRSGRPFGIAGLFNTLASDGGGEPVPVRS